LSYPSTTSYFEDFSTGVSSFVELLGGTWTWDSGSQRYRLYQSASDKPDGVLSNISVYNAVFSGDYTVSGSLEVTGWSGVWDDVALVFGLQDEDNYYYVSLNESNNSNTHGLFKVVAGVPTQLEDFDTAVSFLSDVSYTMTVERVGTQIQVYVDGSLVTTYDDATFTGGQVGFGSANNYAWFDDLMVSGASQ